MLDLKNLGVVEMSSQEVVDTEGGLFDLLLGVFLGFGVGSFLWAVIREL